jgi:prolyl-tRNA synthetase
VIIPIIFKKGGDEIIAACNNIKNKLEQSGIRVILDDSDQRPGKKYYKWELNGVPIRIELGPKDLENNTSILVRRDTKEKMPVSLNEDIVLKVKELSSEINKNLYIKSNEKMQSRIREVKSIEEISKTIEMHRGIISIPWCGHEECGKQIEEITNVDILGTDEMLKVTGKCINCGAEAKFKTFMAKTY